MPPGPSDDAMGAVAAEDPREMGEDMAAGEQQEEDGEEPLEPEEATYFAEEQEVLERLRRLAAPLPEALEGQPQQQEEEEQEKMLGADLEWIRQVLDKYQEQSNLLDPALERMLGIALGRARELVLALHEQEHGQPSMVGAAAQAQAQLQALMGFVYTLCRLRGHKTVTRFFPHEAADLEPVLSALKAQDRSDHGRWQTRYGLLLWLSMLVLVPFDICSIDSGLAGTGEQQAQQAEQATLVGTLCELAKAYLEDPGPTREAAAVCLASLLKRPDMEAEQLSSFLAWSEDVLSPPSADTSSAPDHRSSRSRSSVFLVVGVLQTLATLLKAGHRQNLQAFLPQLLGCLTSPQLRADFGSQTLNRKLRMKLLQRVGLAFLPPRVAGWRYRRGQRSLLDNLNQAAAGAGAAGGVVDEDEDEDEDAMGEEDVPEELEEILEELLSGLRDRDTIVRWSAAKGIGRITSLLPKGFADEVVESVLMSFTDGATDSSWHGGCLALAELARRGLLLPSRLPEVVPLVARAIQYDVRRGHSSVGAHVRDAACYVCWAFARAYAPKVMRPHVPRLCEGMLVTSLFDREINCRRAASAAFQENVGRQGHENFPFGIQILTAADYFTLGNRQHAYLDIAGHVARFPPYRLPLIDHLAQVKLLHWDPAIRALASQALARLTALAPAHMLEAVCPALLAQVDAVDLNRRHGAILGLAEVLLALAQQPTHLPSPLVEAVVDVVPRIEKARLYRGRGGELVRAAACRLIECISLAWVALPVKTQLRLLDSIDENLRHPVEEVQGKAVAACRAFTKAYFGGGASPPSQRLQARVVDKYLATVLSDDNVAVTRGFILALGALPPRLLRPSVDQILAAFDEMARPDRRVGDEPDAETRRNALLALIDACQTLGVGSGQQGGLTPAQLQQALATLLRSIGDYATDKRGDVGSWCRQVALNGLAALLALLPAGPAANEDKATTMLRVGARMRTAYGTGTLVDLRCEGRVACVRFPRGQPGAFFFPYHDGTGLFPPAAIAPCGEPDAGAIPTSPTSPPAIGSETAADPDDPAASAAPTGIDAATFTGVVAAALQQLCEKLDVVRECAGAVLLSLLALPAPPLPQLPDRALLESALLPPEQQAAAAAASFYKAGNPAVVFPRVVRLLSTSAYHRPVVAGMVISIGGLTESVVKASLGAMVEWAQARRQAGERGEIARVGATVLELLDAHQGEDRVVLPLLRSADLFVQKGVWLEEDLFGGGEEEPASLAAGLLARVKRELQGCKDVKKLLACLALAVHLITPLSFTEGQETRETGAGAMRLLMVLLGHRFPRVRKAAAEQLYTKLLLHDQLLERGGPTVQEQALECLATTCWDTADLPSVREARDGLCRLMAICPPAALSASGSGSGSGSEGGKPKQEDELASYAALVKNMGY